MTKVMWTGFNQPDGELPFLVWNEIKFPYNVAVEVTDQHMITKARGNQWFKVIDEEKALKEKSHGESQTQGESKKEQVKVEAKEKDYSFREGEKGTGYSPVKKKVRKKSPPAEDSPERTAT